MSSRAYPDRPFVGVGAVLVDGAARVLLVKRRFEPLAGQWSLPGGAVDVGETLEAVARVPDPGPVAVSREPALRADRQASVLDLSANRLAFRVTSPRPGRLRDINGA